MFWAFYRKAQYLSLDIVLGAVILLRFFSNELAVSPSILIYFLLGASVWLIYTADHLRDAKSGKLSTRGRYQFHLNNEWILKVVGLVVLTASIIALFYIDMSIFLAGLVLIGFAGLYLLVQDALAKNGLKEFYVALVYSSGILLPPFVLASLIRWDILFLLILLTFSNLILFSWYEKKEDEADGFSSIATSVSKANLQRIIYSTLSFGLALAFLLDYSRVNVFFFIGFTIYVMLSVSLNWANQNQRYRIIGDGVFLLPILFEWV